jgi:cobalt/nickel transport system permease protein
MHIADGILPAAWCVGAHAAAWTGIYSLGRRVEPAEVVRMGLLASTTFVISLIHFPLGGTSIHLALFGLSGILLGKRSFPVIFVTLLFQALLFQHGGLLTLGVNSLNMGAGSLCAAGLWALKGVPEFIRAFCCGFAGIMLPAGLMAVEFGLAGYGKGFYFIAGVYVIVAGVEGLLTALMVAFIERVKPAILTRGAPHV